MSTTQESGPLHNATLKAIEAKLGRPLRVLHIGNIANNAYNNARIQRQYGIEADVLSYDYYHVMSTPEWEDAAFEGEIDANAPNWWGTSLKGWKRPDWFVQGPVAPCLQYLRAKHLGLSRLQKLLWRTLEARCLGYVRYMAEATGKPIPPMPIKLGLALKAAEAYGVANGPGLAFDPGIRAQVREILAPEPTPPSPACINDVTPALDSRTLRAARLLIGAIYRSFIDVAVLPGLRSETPSGLLPRLWLWQKSRRLGGASREAILALIDENPPGAEQLAALRGSALYRIRSIAQNALVRLYRMPWGRAAPEVRRLEAYLDTIKTAGRDSRAIDRLIAVAVHFAEVPEQDRLTFYEYYTIFYAQFFDVLPMYDIVQCYSIDGGICWANGLDRFISYEHGTLRDLPFGQDFYGIVTRIAYHASTHVFVTNSDVLPSTRRMGLDPACVICLPHAFDDRKLVAFRDQNPGLQPPPGPAVFFSPTRHHWIDTSGSWTKGNDILLRAAGIVAAEGLEFRLLLVEWGKEVEASKALIAELGIAEKVTWVGTMQKRELWEAYCLAHAVVDQFTLPALGGVGFETMALGRRLITAIDVNQLTQFFGEAPPCLSASSVEQCAGRLRQVINDPGDTAGLGHAAARWMQDYHSAERIVGIQADTYREFLMGSLGPAKPVALAG